MGEEPVSKSLYKELAQHEPAVQSDALEREQVEQERAEIAAQYVARGCEYAPGFPRLPDGDVPPVILPAHENPWWMHDAPPPAGDRARVWGSWEV